MLEKILSYLTKFLMKMIFVTLIWNGWSSACYKYPQLKSKTKEEICRGTWRSARHFRLPRITPFIFRRCGRPSTLSHVRWCTLDYKPGVTSTKDKSFAIETPRAQGDRDHRPEIPKSPAWLRFSLQRDTPDKFTSRVAPLFTSSLIIPSDWPKRQLALPFSRFEARYFSAVTWKNGKNVKSRVMIKKGIDFR